MRDLADVFELIIDGLGDGPLTQEKFVRSVEQTMTHMLAGLGDEVKAMRHQKLLSQGLGKGVFVTKEQALESFDLLGNGVSVINVAWLQAIGYQFALIIDDRVQLEALEPDHGGLASCGSPSKHPVLMDAWVTADRKRCRIDKADAGTAAQLRMQIGHQRNQDRGH